MEKRYDDLTPPKLYIEYCIKIQFWDDNIINCIVHCDTQLPMDDHDDRRDTRLW
jgi:hypothetical protein